MKIYERLRKDHDTQRELARQLSATSGATDERRDLWEQFREEATAHASAEEQTFYAELIARPDGQEKARHSVHEHKKAADLIEELDNTDMGSGAWLQKFEKLKEELEHHMREEENEVFKRARKLLDETTETELTRRFEKRKEQERAEA